MAHHHFFIWKLDLAATLASDYNTLIVLLSYLIAALAGFCAFSIIKFIQANKSKQRLLIISGGITLGLGIWSMHFTGMLAFTLAIPVLYDPKLTLISILPAILTSIIFIENLSKDKISHLNIALTALLLTVGITTMHFIGMAAMSMQAYMAHDIMLVILAVFASWTLATLTILFEKNKFKITIVGQQGHLVLSALTFGFSVASMHYLAMYATFFFADKAVKISGLNNQMLTNGLILFTVFLMALLLVVLFYQNKIGGLIELAYTHQKRVIQTIDNMQDGFVLSDSQGNILLLNKKFQEVFCNHSSDTYREDDNVNTLYKRLSASHFNLKSQQEFNRILNVFVNENDLLESFKVQDNYGRWWLLRHNRTSSNTLIQTWTDITAQIEQETELLEVKKIASLGCLVSGMAHELNTPLGNSIMALSSIEEIVKSLQLSLLAGTIKKSTLDGSLQTIVEFELLAGTSLNRMVNLIQQFKYISIEQDIEKPQKFSLSAAISSLLATCNKTLSTNNIKLNTHIEPALNLFSYKNALLQVINCFISNSIEHAFTQCKNKEISIEANIENNRLVLHYSDNGCGIDKTIVNSIFEPFITTNRGKGGIGLGLHIAYIIVFQKLKGRIKLDDSELSKQTRFTIDMPSDIT